MHIVFKLCWTLDFHYNLLWAPQSVFSSYVGGHHLIFKEFCAPCFSHNPCWVL